MNPNNVRAAKTMPATSYAPPLPIRPKIVPNGPYHQLNSNENASASTVSVTPRSTSFVMIHWTRLRPCVQAKRNVPDSNSRATTGAPTKTPSSPGRNVRN